jgi:ribonuclease BN (tRNA processing enzyme)
MEAILLGTGSALPSPERLQSGTLVETDGQRLLVDCGSGVTHRLAQAGVDVATVDTVLLTHHHLDHVADLPTLAKARSLQGHDQFTVAGPPGTREICRSLFSVDDLADRLTLQLTEHTPAQSPLSCRGHRIELVETTHSKQCFAYRFGDRLALSGDTAPDEDVFALADGVEVFVHECGALDEDTSGHTTAAELAAGLQSIDVDHVVLTHLFPSAEAQADRLQSIVADRVDATVTVGTDLDVLL